MTFENKQNLYNYKLKTKTHIHYKTNFKVLTIFFILFLLSCQPSKNAPEISFYYWKTVFKLSENERICLNNNNVKNLYIRYFDIDLDEYKKPFPREIIRFEELPENIIIIPVVYIKNSVMLKDSIDLSDLAKKINDLINQINRTKNINSHQLQIDCDWTLNSKDNFMKFMGLIKTISKKKISVTIRLHQIKYAEKTGIPIADYGVLMYYNMGKIAGDSLNSVYDRETALKYLSSLDSYPLDLDLALPIFFRGVQIRDNKVVNLISKIDTESFKNDTNFIIQDKTLVKVKNPNFKLGYYFKKNDLIKIENINFEQLIEMSEDVNSNLHKTPKRIIFFDLDSLNLKKYSDENQDFKEIVNSF